MTKPNNICLITATGINGNSFEWYPALVYRYNYIELDRIDIAGLPVLPTTTNINELVEDGKRIAEELKIKMCVSNKFVNRPETIGLSMY